MPNIERGFVPLSRAEEHGGDRARYDFELPDYVDKNKIGVNIAAIDRACKLGGIYLDMHGVSGMETSSAEADVVGMNEKGEAVAGKTRVNQVDLIEFNSATAMPPFIPHQMRSTHSHVHYNLDEMTTRISSQGDKSAGVRSPREWAKVIDTATKDTVSTLGQIQLLKLLTGPEKNIPLILDANAVLTAADASPLDLVFGTFDPEIPPDPIWVGFHLSLVNSILNSMDYVGGRLKFGKEGMSKLGFRHSFFNGPQYDRALILKGYTKLKTFFKEIK